MPHWPPFGGSLSSVSGDSCSQSIYGTLSIDWHKLDSKLYSAKPTGHSRELLWTHLFVQKHRQNPFQEREYQGYDTEDVYKKWYDDQRYMDAYKSTRTLRGVDSEGAMMGFNIENLTAKQALLDGGRPRKALTASKKNFFRMFGTLTLRWLTSPLVPNCLITVEKVLLMQALL